MTEIKWQEPPPRTSRSDKDWPGLLAPLRERPGQWALIATAKHPSAAQSIRNGMVAGTKKGEFEATSRKRDDGQHDIYARYVGKSS